MYYAHSRPLSHSFPNILDTTRGATAAADGGGAPADLSAVASPSLTPMTRRLLPVTRPLTMALWIC
jgi:hypothetical protein